MNEVASAVSTLCGSLWVKLTIIGAITFYLMMVLKEKSKIRSTLAGKIEVARRDRDESIAWAREQAELIGDEDRKRIETMDFTQLREALQTGKVTAENVLRVYYGLAIKAHEKTNCLTGIVKESLDMARELDEKAKDRYYKKPRLFGIPISIKEAVQLAGHHNTWGLAKLIDYLPTEDSYQVMKLKLEGMVPFCQTNIPTTCMTYTCSNSIYGTTKCPQNPSRTSGGSSGGEGALIGSGGSICGLGSDLAGSVRIPAAFSGCCGFKPSATRFSITQIDYDFIPSRSIMTLTEGPMAQDPHAIVEMMRALWSDHFISDHDPSSVPIDFREDLFKEGRKFRVGYYTADGYIDPLPGNQRVVREAVELLKIQGHDLVPFSLENIMRDTGRNAFTLFVADGGARIVERLRDEPMSLWMAPLRYAMYVPLWITKPLGWFFRLMGDTGTADFLLAHPTNASHVSDAVDKVFSCRKQIIQMMKDQKIDLILCPSTIFPAPPHSLPNTIPHTAMLSTMLWNAMDFPAGVVTTGSWTKQDEDELKSYPVKGLAERVIKQRCRNNVGLPLSVQIVAPAFRDEMVLRVMVDLFDAVKNRAM
ncbi:hypothetical protein PENTCL1PPCAC_28890 [Pristionchus entomophagus]|uniref:Amidase domain-containing protein n=1 Tax=Pristionchus entomophagus TaxID=358040 RepID=A0AAV5UI21_9BILA|nr:hypothetical protein PENTCL1PPCAC_28890 [Pristionchus entomophagus]